MNEVVSGVLDAVAGVMVVVGALFVLVSAIAMLRQRDAFSRINVMSPATGFGLPLIVVAAFLHRIALGVATWGDGLKTVVTVIALLVVSSVATNILARAGQGVSLGQLWIVSSRMPPRHPPSTWGRPVSQMST